MMLAAVTICTGCKKDNTDEPSVEPSLSVLPASIPAAYTAGTYDITVTSNSTWTAAVNSAATWCTLTSTAGNGNGTVTVSVIENPTMDERAATATFTSGVLAKTVGITQAANPATPPHAASTQTWIFGNQTWSDAIRIPECNKTSFDDSYTDPHCRSYTSGSNTWYYYNWPYVNANAAQLCPSPWHVPSESDVQSLVDNFNSTALISAWGYGGLVYGSSEDGVSSGAYYWSSTEDDSYSIYSAYGLVYDSDNLDVISLDKQNGFQVRCVK